MAQGPRSYAPMEEAPTQETDDVQIQPIDIETDTYGMLVVAVVRDAHFIAKGDRTCCVRLTRLLITVGLLSLTVGFQVFVLWQLKLKVSAKAVHDIRVAYDTYEKAIYNGTKMTITHHGGARGDPKNFPGVEVARKRLMGLEEDTVEDICRIPLSQPYFFMSILLLWTITVIIEVRGCLRSFYSIIVATERTDSMANAILEHSDEIDDDDGKIRVVGRLTCCMKLAMSFFCFLPRIVICMYLWWIGCRWLLATNDFENLILNSVALEFILLLKDTIYEALMPYRNRVDLENTKVRPAIRRLVFTNYEILHMLSGTSWLIIGVLTVVLYIFVFQDVLPNYNWDAHEVCEDYIAEAYKV